MFGAALEELGVVRQRLVREMRDVYRGHKPRIALADDARQYLEDTEGVVPMAAVTDGPIESQRAKVDALGLDRWFRPIVLTEEMGPDHRKPSPLAFSAVAAQFPGRADRFAYVADNPAKDFAGPASLGWLTYRVRRPRSLHASLESGPAVACEIESLLELPEAIDASSASHRCHP